MTPGPARSALCALALTVLAASPVLGADRDGDGLRDAFERRGGVTAPDRRDSDGDGVIDAAEDSDGDRLSNLAEQRFGTRPDDADSDGDGRPDGKEDDDRDGISNAREQDQRPLPAHLSPSLAHAKSDYPAVREACFAKLKVAVPLRCVFGPTESDTSIAVFGDSHALMWAPALVATAKAEGWKLVTFFKGGCPSLYVRSRGQVQLDGHRSCRAWRESVLAALRAQPPDLVIITNSDGYKIVDLKGKRMDPTRRVKAWRSGLRRMLADLPEESAVLVLGDVPQNDGNPIKCLSTHRQDMSACASRRTPPRKRHIEAVERSVSATAGAQFRTLHDQVCTYDPCPLVQGNVLMWRDAGHLSSTMVRKLTPSMRRLLRDVVAGIEPGPGAAAESSSELPAEAPSELPAESPSELPAESPQAPSSEDAFASPVPS